MERERERERDRERKREGDRERERERERERRLRKKEETARERERERERDSRGQGMALTMLALKSMLDEHLSFSFINNLAHTDVWNNHGKKRKREWVKITLCHQRKLSTWYDSTWQLAVRFLKCNHCRTHTKVPQIGVGVFHAWLFRGGADGWVTKVFASTDARRPYPRSIIGSTVGA